MKATGMLLIGTAMFGTAMGCAAEVGNDDSEQTQASALEAAKAPDLAPAASQFLVIRVSNTSFCFSPTGVQRGGGTTIELQACDHTKTIQNWLRVPNMGGNELINQSTGQCLYYGGAAPIFNGATPILMHDCNVTGSSAIATNSIWRLTAATGFTVFESKLSNTDTNFCIDLPGGNSGIGATLQMWHCNGLPQQTFSLE